MTARGRCDDRAVAGWPSSPRSRCTATPRAAAPAGCTSSRASPRAREQIELSNGRVPHGRLAELAAIALHGYPRSVAAPAASTSRAARAEQIELSNGRVPTVVWDCPGCGEKRSERHEERAP
jgi:hypothetical protein